MQQSGHGWEWVLLQQLNSTDPESVLDAVRELRSVGPEGLVRLVRAAGSRRATGPVGWLAVGAGLLALVGLALVNSLGNGSVGGALFAAAVAIWIAMALAAYVQVQRVAHPDASVQMLAVHIETHATAEALPALVTLLRDDLDRPLPAPLRRGVQTAMQRMLPQVTEQEYRALSTDRQPWHTPVLHAPYAEPALSAEIIRTLGRLGDPADVQVQTPLIEFARRSAITPNMQLVRQAARQALAQLEERRADAALARSLLRPSERSGQNSTAELVRPGPAGGVTHANHLVRAAMTDEVNCEPDVKS